jgi:two-component system, chemotaxis family, CheB/CheR fusion protein
MTVKEPRKLSHARRNSGSKAGEDRNRMFVVGIGASAGGLEALEAFFENVLARSRYVYVIVHNSPQPNGSMNELLSKRTGMKLVTADEGMTLQTGHIYVIPPRALVTLEGDRLHLVQADDRSVTFPLNLFFESLARSFGESCAGVVLSGTGSDGTEGLKAIKEAGGLVLVQEPSTAQFDGMPKSAIKAGIADIVLEPQQMFVTLDQVLSQAMQSFDPLSDDTSDEVYSSILRTVSDQTGVDFTGYKQATVLRRIQRRMQLCQVERIQDYYEFLLESPLEAQLLRKEVLISVTGFFRDTEAFRYLEETVIPHIAENKKDKPIRVWVPACSTGEEAYSIAFLFSDYMHRTGLTLDVTIFATDIDPAVIKSASSRVYSEGSMSRLAKDHIKRYFTRTEEGYKVVKEVRDMLVFSTHNIIKDPPFYNIDLLSCRNLLIYFRPELQKKVISLFSFVIVNDGFLFLGSSESLGDKAADYRELSSKWKIYQNRKSRKFDMHMLQPGVRYPQRPHFKQQLRDTNRMLIEQINKALINEYAPTTFFVKDDMTLVHTTGNAAKYLTLPKGEITYNILRMLPESLAVTFEVGIMKVFNIWQPVVLKNVKFVTGGKLKKLNLEIQPFVDPDLPHRLVRVRLDELKLPRGKQKDDGILINMEQDGHSKLSLLEEELRISKDNLQMTVEELEAANEELQAANEELHSTNEELEAMNEELHTVNSEYQLKVLELTEANDDLNNLLQSTDIGTLFLDPELRIRRFTKTVTRIMNLQPQDIGRHIGNYSSAIKYPHFFREINEVSETLTPKAMHVQDLSDKWYVLRIHPFKTIANEIKGIVITFVDITNLINAQTELQLSQNELKAAHQRQSKIEELYDTISRNTRDIIGLHEPGGLFHYVSPSVKDVLGYEPEELVGTSMYDLLHEDDRANLPGHVLSMDGNLQQQTEYRVKRKDGSYLWLETSSRFITDEKGKIAKLLTSSRDVTFRKRAELSIRASEERYRTLFDNNPFPMFVLSPVTLRFLQVNTAAVSTYGYAAEEFSAMELWHLLHEPPCNTRDSCEVITFGHWQHRTKSGKVLTVELSSNPISFDHGNAVLVLVNDITERAELEEEVAERTRELMLSEGRFRVLAESIPQIIWTASPQGIADYYNERWYDFTGLKHRKSIDQDWWKQVLHPQDIKPVMDAWRNSVATGEDFSIECRIKGKWAGVYKWFLGKALPLRDTDGSIVKWFGTFTNIDDQKQLEQRKDEFIGIASHELKTPLTSIKAYTELLERRLMDGEDGTSRIYITKTNGYIKKLGQLISDLLDVSKIQAGKLQFHMQEFDADEFLKESIDNIRHLSQKHRIIAKGKVNARLVGDRQRLEQVLSNLLSNAMKYSPEADEVEVNVYRDDERVTISVTDYGIGIPADKHSKLFERFFRVEKNAYRFQGLGIGLYISSEIVHRHGGKIWVESEEGQGATFYFTIPLPGTQPDPQGYAPSL